jgi:hypothetical protein
MSTLAIILIPRLNIHKRLAMMASLYIIFGHTYYVALNFIGGCIILYLKPSNSLFCRLARTIFNGATGALEPLEKAKSKIFICNYPDLNLVEYFTQGLLPQNYALVVNKKFKKYVCRVYPPDRLILLEIDNPKKDNYSDLLRAIKIKIDLGYNILCYFDTKYVGGPPKAEPNSLPKRSLRLRGTKSPKAARAQGEGEAPGGELGGEAPSTEGRAPKARKKFWRYGLKGVRNGIFNIASQLQIPILPIVMDHLYIDNGSIPPQKFRIKVLEEIVIKDQSDITRTIINYKNTLKKFHSSKFL